MNRNRCSRSPEYARDALAVEKPSKQHVINCLHRQHTNDTAPTLSTPPALVLEHEPQADTQRYDQLRGEGYAH